MRGCGAGLSVARGVYGADGGNPSGFRFTAAFRCGFMRGNGGAVFHLILPGGEAVGGGFVRIKAGAFGGGFGAAGAVNTLARFDFGGFGGADGISGGVRCARHQVFKGGEVTRLRGGGGIRGGGEAGGGARFGGGVPGGAGGVMILPGFATRFGGTRGGGFALHALRFDPFTVAGHVRKDTVASGGESGGGFGVNGGLAGGAVFHGGNTLGHRAHRAQAEKREKF